MSACCALSRPSSGPLEEWARRRAERQAASKGKRRAVPLGDGPHRGAHVDPGAPRSIEEWTGTEWHVVGVVENLAAAQALLYPPPPELAKPAEWDRPAMGKGRGRHRKPTSAEERVQQAAERPTVVTAHQRRSAKAPLRRQAVASRA
ncbi:DUF6087 family protein [Streptomyces sp. H27-H1]|uniref:DUF6087 family protein n=1 Tax=unclassified Streptomyces TaxID=2593676 RepID=UPI00227177BF|nr:MULTISPECIES: DUF6087 family protein [unclassified Streptomyces]MCY0927033.1 DUF6087 family protein [Streptomyces sp. H27-H1]MCY0933296.1 DUF6087 family protein [Streptomyces sp. H34-S4]